MHYLFANRVNIYRPVFFALALLVLFIVPTRHVGLADGLPVDHPLELFIALLLVGGLFILPWHIEPKKARMLAFALAVIAMGKLAVASTSLPHGLLARYYANPNLTGPPEVSLEFRIDGATRIDRTIDFAPVGFSWTAKPFPLWFLNDKKRFNYFKPGEPDRKRLPFRVRWDGFIEAPTTEPLTLRLATEQEATLELLGQTLISTADGVREFSLALNPGWHPIGLTYVWRGQGPRSLKLEWGHDGEFRPVPASALLPFEPSPSVLRWERKMAFPAKVIFVLQFLVVGWVVAAGLGGLTKRAFITKRMAVYLLVVVMAAFGTASLGKRGRAPNWNILNGGDDPLLYETAARQIVLERDLLNRMTEPPKPFYNMPGYRYYLAAVHAVLGESKAMVVMSHYYLLAVACALTYYLIRLIAPPGPSLFAAAMLFSGQAHGTVYRWATELFPTILGLALVGAMLLAMARWGRQPSTLRALAGGLLAGLATVVRPNVIAFVPFAVTWMALAPTASKEKRWKGAAAALLAATLAIAPITWRNWHVSGEFALLVSSSPTMLYAGNPPPPGSVDYSQIESDPLYERLELSPLTRKVLEYLRQRPGAFLKGLGAKGLQTLGFLRPFSLSLVMLHLGYFAGAVLFWRKGVARRLSLLLHSFVLSQWFVLVIFKPYPHLPKTQLPTYIVAFGFASLLIVSLAYAAFKGRLPSALSLGGPRWSNASRLLGAAAALCLLAAITYPPRLPLVIPVLLGAIWLLHKDPASSLSSTIAPGGNS